MLAIHLSAITANVAQLKTATASTPFMAVVKNNAYGHGLVPVARAAVTGGANWLGVVHVHEGVALREAGLAEPILVLGYAPPGDIAAAVEHGLDVAAMSADHARAVAAAVPAGARLRVHLKIETGLHRFGATREDLPFSRELIAGAEPKLQVVGVHSHLAAVEDAEYAHALRQGDAFEQTLIGLGVAGKTPVIRHLAATAGALLLPQLRFDLVRCGIGIYGLWPSPETRAKLGQPSHWLQPALSWREPVVALKSVGSGQPVGYGCTWHPLRDSRIALLAVGYADGLDRLLSNAGQVLVRNQVCPIVGRICTNVTFVDVTSVPGIQVGDQVTLIAADNDSPVSAERQARWANTINYELVTRLPADLPREFKEDMVR